MEGNIGQDVVSDVTSGADVTESRYEAIVADIEKDESIYSPQKAEEGTTEKTEDEPKTEEADYGGFKTLDELKADYESKKKEAEELSSLKGRQGNEIGQARAEIQRLSGMLEAYKTAIPQHPQTPAPDTKAQLTEHIAELEKKYENGEMTIGQLFAAREEAIRTSMTSEMESLVQKKLDSLKGETEKERNIKNFLDSNPGYIDAYKSGKLSEFINSGMPGEWAWDRHQLNEAKSTIESLNKKIADAEKQAREQGFQLGVKAEKGKEAAGKVLGSGKAGTSFSQQNKPTKFKDENERTAAAVALLRRMKT